MSMREHDSTLITSAPMNPSKSVAYGPTATCVRSRIRSPSKASCGMLSPCSLDNARTTQLGQGLSGVTEAGPVHLHLLRTQQRASGVVAGGALGREGGPGDEGRTSAAVVDNA